MPEENATAATRLAAAERLAAIGDLFGCFGEVRALLAIEPTYAPAWTLLARLFLHREELEPALGAARRAITLAPALGAAHGVAALAYAARGEHAAAIAAFRRALELEPSAEWLAGLANSLRACGAHAQAVEAAGLAVSMQPNDSAVRDALGRALAAVGRDVDAAPHQYAAARAFAAEAESMLHAARRHVDAADLQRALDALLVARRRAPHVPEVHERLAIVFHALGRFEDEMHAFAALAALAPDAPDAWDAARAAATSLGYVEEARRHSTAFLALRRRDSVAIRSRLLLPAVAPSIAAIDESRRNFRLALDEFLHAPVTMELGDTTLGGAGFFLAYHGAVNRDLHADLARVLLRACPALAWEAPDARHVGRAGGRRRRIGLASRYLRDHSIGRTTCGLVARLDRREYEVFAIHIGAPPDDETTRFVAAHADATVVLDGDFATMRERLAALQLDVLFFQDIGLDPVTQLLALARLAPVQCTSFGHPDTTGSPGIDYFVSNDLYEPEGADAHYSERLFRLHDLPTLAYYYRPARPAVPPRREQFRLPNARRLYLCPQMLFKVHPDFDPIIAAILRLDPEGEVVFIEGLARGWGAALRARFAATMPDVHARIRFVPRVAMPAFTTLLLCADVILDTPHFNGMNTSLESLAMGVPVVTLPGAFQRARHTAAMLRRMGVEACIARDGEDYARLAVRIASDADFGRHVRTEIGARSPTLFEHEPVVREFERFFATALDGARA